MKVSKKKIQKEQTRKKILDASYRVFSQRGYFSTISMFAEETGIARGSIYVHFSALDNLLVCLFKDFFHRVVIRLHDSMQPASENGKNLEDVLSAHLDIIEEHEDFYIYLVSDMDLLPDDVKTLFLEFQSVLSRYFNNMIDKAKKDKTIKHIPQHIFFHTWIGLVHYYLQNKELFAQNESVIKRHRKELISSFLKLISAGSE